MSLSLPRLEYYRGRDGRHLTARVWRAAGEPRAHVVFLHGITSHGGWYNRSCSHLAEAGHDVHFLDRRGSGLDALRPGDVDRHETWLDDVEQYLERIRDQRRLVLGGISWGGKLAVAVARHRPHLVQGLMLLCPGLYSPYEAGLLRRMLLAAPKPARLQRRRVAIPLKDPALFTDSPRWREYIAHDPLSLRQVTVRFARADRRLTRYARESATFLHLPLLVMLSGRDRIVNNRRVRAFFGRAPSAHKTLVDYPNAAHTLEFEPDPVPYFRDLADWIGKLG